MQLAERHELSLWGPDDENGFIVIQSPQIASVDSRFFIFHPEKWGTVPQPKILYDKP